jgi:hypothetical protein
MTETTSRRPDISEGLIHLTKVKNGKSAFEVLQQILTSGKLIGSGNFGFVKGTRNAVCLSEAPLSAVSHLIAKSKANCKNKPKEPYSTYGIAISKESIYKLGGRPVIYLPDVDAEWIPDDEKWRQVRFEPPQIDWSHEREWRLPGNLDLSSVKGLYVLVSNATEAKTIQLMDWPAKSLLRGILPMEHLNRFL